MDILARILALVFRHKWWLAAAYVTMLGATAGYLVLPWLIGTAVDRIVVGFEDDAVSRGAILSITIMILVTGAFRGAMAFGQAYLGELLSQKVVYDMRSMFYDHLQHMSFGFHDRHHTGNLISRAITDVEAVRMFVQMGLVRTPYFLLLFIVVAAAILRLDWRLGLLGISFMPIIAVLTVIVRLQLGTIWRHIQEIMADLSTILQENLSGVRVVKAFASESYEEAKFNVKNQEVADGIIKATKLQAMNAAFMRLVFLGALGMILWYGGSQVIDEHLSWGELAQALLYMQVLAIPVRHAGMMVNSYARAIAAGQRLFEILDTKSPVRESDSAAEMPRVRGDVRFKSVGFAYQRGTSVLKDIDIDVKSGQIIALLGVPGSGKSTIVHLLPRFYDVGSGRITIDGTDIRDVTLASLRRNISIVQQDVFLFTTTIRDNIAYGRHDATLEEVVEAAKIAQLDEHIQGLEKGYETVLGERGVTLSGGQRQRLSIARAVLMDPAILILDDSTSSVDASTEEQIRQAMESVMVGRTTFVIAHRLSTVHRADQILVLQEGEVVERGVHEELLAHGSLYRRIYDLQLRPQEEVMLDYDVPAVPAKKESTR